MIHAASKKPFVTLILAGIFAISFAGTGCSKKSTVQEDQSSVPTAADADQNPLPATSGDVGGDSDNGKAMGLQTINFPYDSFVIDSEGKSRAKANIAILKDKTSVKIQIEGHCDQRGGIQYNLALGEKRANAVRKYFVDAGIAKDRVTTISFGKERPLDPGSSEDAYAKNRRANFVITSH